MKIQVILGSTRPGRIGERVAKWVIEGFSDHAGVEVELVDLADFELPHFDEPMPPRANKNRRPSNGVDRYLEKIAQADGYIIITPEYNHSIPGILKDALDFVDYQMYRKPVGIVSYGLNGGTRASQALKLVLNGVKAVVTPESVALTAPQAVLNEAGDFTGDADNPFGPNRSLETAISELTWWVESLEASRRADAKINANS